MSAPWQTFRSTGSSHEVASLFAKYNFGSAGYTVLLTDLTYIWEESLDRKQIIKRALDLDTPIDPSEDGSQMQLLLRHVRESFEGRAGTSVTVSGRHDAGELNVNISVPLDSPLPPLQWPLYLARAAQSVFTAEFVMPNLRICSLAHAQINSLLQHLTEKDNIIDKLTEKLQSDGNGLSNLFPGASVSRTGSKLNPRQTVGKSVKGFSAFDEKQWREQIPPSFDSNEDIDMIVSTVFDSDIAPLSNPGQRFSNHSRLQLTNFDQAKSTEGMTEVPTSGLEARNPESTFDSFQRQSTPPRSNSTTVKSTINSKSLFQQKERRDQQDDDSTTDESHENISSKKHEERNTPYEDPPIQRKSSGDAKEPASIPKENRNNSRPHSANRSMSPYSTEDNGTNREKAMGKSSETAFIRTGSSGSRPKQKLGKIGGKSFLHAFPLEGSATEVNSIGNDDSKAQKQSTDIGEPLQQPKPSAPREMNENVANENRKRLQQDLEAKARMAKKKKRKF